MTYYGYDAGRDRIAVFEAHTDLEEWIAAEKMVGWKYEVSEEDIDDYFVTDRNLYDLIVGDDGTQYLILGNTWMVFRALDITNPRTGKFQSDRFTSGVADVLAEGKYNYIVEKLLVPAMLEEAKYEIEEFYWKNPPSCDISTLERIFNFYGTSIDDILVKSVLKYTEKLFKELLNLKNQISA